MYSIWIDSMMHQGSFWVEYKKGVLGLVLMIYQTLGTIAGIGILIYFGVHNHWYYPLILIPTSLIGTIVLRGIETSLGAAKFGWALAIAGFIVIPATMVISFLIIKNGAI